MGTIRAKQDESRNDAWLVGFVQSEGYDPASLVSTDVYTELMLKVMRESRRRGRSGSDAWFVHYLGENADSLTGEEQRRKLQQIFRYQDELLFIQQGTDISYYPIWYRFPAHFHRNSYFDLAWVFHGTARYYFPDVKTVDLKPGDLLIIPPESEHGECAVAEGTKAITCSIRRSAFLRLFLSVFEDNSFLQTFFRRMLSGSASIPYLLFDTRMTEAAEPQSGRERCTPAADGKEDPVLAGLFRKVMEEHDRKAPYYNKMLDFLMGQIFVRLLRCHEQQMILPESVQFLWKPEYGAIFHFIEENYTQHLSLDDLSERFHYSRRQLIRIIRECTGQGYSDLIRSSRMRFAKDLLSGTNLPVEEVADRCGYENSSSFSRAFSASEGMSPGAWREMNCP